MKTIDLNDGFVSIKADKGFVLRRKDYTDPYSDIGETTVPAEHVSGWEEVSKDEIPPYPEQEYKAEVERLVRTRYTASDEIGILRQRETKPAEFAEYDAYVEACKAQAKKELTAQEEEAEG